MTRTELRRGRAARLLLLLLVGTLAACGLDPPEGVRVDRRVVGSLDDEPDVLRLPSGPRGGETPEQVVRGFLGAAAAAPEAGHALARSFLVSGSAWQDGAGASVYDPTTLTVQPVPAPAATPPSTPPASTEQAAFRLAADRIATLDADGGYLPAKGRVEIVLRLQRSDREWRVESPPPGVLLTPRDLTRSFRPVSRHLLAPGANTLVPDPVYLSGSRSTLPGAAVRSLFAGPRGWLGPSVRSAIPTGLLPLGSVVVTDGVAVVDLDRAAFDVPLEVRPVLVGQLAATLGTVAGVERVRVLAEGRAYQEREPLVAAGVPPALRPVLDGPTYAVAPGGALLRVQAPAPGEAPAGVAAVPGAPAQLLTAVADPAGSGTIAAVQTGPEGPRLLLGPLGDLRPVALPAPALLGPTWVPGRGVVVVLPGPRLAFVTPAGEVSALAATGLGLLGPPREVLVSPDGTRILLRTGPADPDRPAAGERSELWLGRLVERSASLSAEAWFPVSTGLEEPARVSWSGSTSLVLTARRADAPRGLWRVRLDQLADPERIPTEGLPEVPTAVSAATGRSPLVVVDDRLWRLDGDRWTALAAARAVAHPH